MKVLIVGAGIGGLAAGLCLHEAGIEVEIFEQTRELTELGVGINLLPHATRELAALGLLSELDGAGIRTRELIYTNRFGQVVWREPRGTEAGYDVPQFSIHRGKLHRVLLRALLSRIGAGRLHTGHVLTGFKEGGTHVVAHLVRRDGQRITATGDALIGCDGIHSAVRAALYPREGPPVSTGITVWRGATDWPRYRDGRTMVIAGGLNAKFVFYPIHGDPAMPAVRLTNWAVMARLAQAAKAATRREDWNRTGSLYQALSFTQHRFSLGFVDPIALIEATRTFFEFRLCDRDPLPRWSFGRVTLLGDAAHPLSPVGSNGAGQAILDARALTRHLTAGGSVVAGLESYDLDRRPPTTALVLSNRMGGPERVIDIVEERAPNGFDDIETVIPHAERQAIVNGYARLAGYGAPYKVSTVAE